MARFKFFNAVADDAAASGGGSGPADKGQGGTPQDDASKGAPASNLIDALKGAPADDKKPPQGDPAKSGDTLLAGKYKTPGDLEKGYKELETKFGEQAAKLKGFAGAPEAYDLSMPEALKDQIEWRTDDPLLTKFQALAKEHGMSQALFGGILGILAEYELSNVSPDWAREKAAIGERADERLKDFTEWYGANMEDEDADRIKRALGVNPSPADIYLALEAVMQAGREPAAKPADDTKDAVTLADVDREWAAKNEKGERLVDVDPAYRERIRAKRARVVGQGDHKVIVGKQ